MDTEKDLTADIVSTLNGDKKSYKKRVIWLIVFFLIAAVFYKFSGKNNTPQISYETKQLKRGDIVVRVTATGTLEPTNQVEVGSELSGTIEEIYADYNDNVKKGSLLARLDVSKLKAQVVQMEASLQAAKAKVLLSAATVEETKSKLLQYENVYRLSEGKVPSQTVMDAAKASYARAEAEKAAAEAAVAEVEASLNISKTDLSKADIISPIDGVVLNRCIEQGQTVAASFEAPVLFELAEDLVNMELHVDVDEADIGSVADGQRAEFTVDAYPNRTFDAVIKQVRYAATTTDGVVTYETILSVENSDLSLRPGMTATASIIVKEVNDVLVVPAAALRFNPSAGAGKKESASITTAFLPRPPGQDKANEVVTNNNGPQKVWVLKDSQPVKVDVVTGVTDGINTEIKSGDITEQSSVIVAAATAGK